MSMEHKAFVFDTETFHSAIEPVMRDSVANPEVARQYICEHYDGLQSPYTGEPLDEDWEDEFDEPDLQVYFDIMLTSCYDVEDDMGLGCFWDAVNDVIGQLDVFEDPRIAVLGRSVMIDDVQVDPGMMGLGLVESHEVPDIRKVLSDNRDGAEAVEPDGLLHDVERDEWLEAYDELCGVYEEALRRGKGLLFTF